MLRVKVPGHAAITVTTGSDGTVAADDLAAVVGENVLGDWKIELRAADNPSWVTDGALALDAIDNLSLVSATRSRREAEGRTVSLDVGFAAQTPSLPGAGSAAGGLGETFTPDLSTGTGTFTVPLDLPNGPNDIGPKLVLRYDTASPNGPFGQRVGAGAPAAAPQHDAGPPALRRRRHPRPRGLRTIAAHRGRRLATRGRHR